MHRSSYSTRYLRKYQSSKGASVGIGFAVEIVSRELRFSRQVSPITADLLRERRPLGSYAVSTLDKWNSTK